MQLTQKQFQSQFENGHARLALLAQSNAGKSYLTRHLEAVSGWTAFEVDKALGSGLDSHEEAVRFLGNAASPERKKREDQMLKDEMNAVVKAPIDIGKNLVLDLPGSAAHYDAETRQWLQANFLMVHLAMADDQIDLMLERYLEHPKPVLWQGNYKLISNETEAQTLARCYPDLFRQREKAYAEMADVQIAWQVGETQIGFLDKVKGVLT
jgi:hypothetical protein